MTRLSKACRAAIRLAVAVFCVAVFLFSGMSLPPVGWPGTDGDAHR